MEGPQGELVKVFGFWSSVLVLKVLALVVLTARYRFSKKIFANPGDLQGIKSGKVSYDDPDIERVRRCHRNDLENVLPWFIITYIYLGTNPSYALASLLIRAFVLSRIVHTTFYAVFPAQPFRAISFFVGYFIMIYQAVVTLVHFL